MALVGAGALCCFVSAMVAPHNIKFYAPDPGSPPVIYTVPSTPPPPDAPLTPLPEPTASSPLPPIPPPNRSYLSCSQMAGWTFQAMNEYWLSVGAPSALDNDGDGIPCETTHGERVTTPESWPTDVWTPPPLSTRVPAAEEAPLITPPPVPADRLPEAAYPAPSPIPLPDVKPSGFLVP